MYNEETKSGRDSGVFNAPANSAMAPEKSIDAPQEADGFQPIQLIPVALSWVAGWLYIGGYEHGVWLWIALAALLTVWMLISCPPQRRNREHWLWMAGMWCSAVHQLRQFIFPTHGLYMPIYVWSESFLLLPLFFPIGMTCCWAISCRGLTTEKGSSGYFLLDLWNALLILPFRRFFGRLNVLLAGIRTLKGGVDVQRRRRMAYGMVTGVIALAFLMLALPLLMGADAAFAGALSGITLPRLNSAFIWELILSLPVGAWLYSLITGSGDLEEDWGSLRGGQCRSTLLSFRRLPRGSWYAVLAAFILLYAWFFAVQGRELLQVLATGLAPGNDTMAEYARRGFWEMCMLVALNMGLLMTAVVTSEGRIHRGGAGRILLTVLLLESLLFTCSAAVKLVLYFRAFGVTAYRLQGAWGILVLAFGCLCCLVWLWTGRKTGKWWCRFVGVTLALTMLV